MIACGGGGIPVLQQSNRLKGASAVIEKDLAAAKLAEAIDADMLLLFTGVPKVCLGYGTEKEKQLDDLSTERARQYLAAGEFEAGSMAPKIEAAIGFIGNSAVRKAVITRLDGRHTDQLPVEGTIIHK